MTTNIILVFLDTCLYIMYIVFGNTGVLIVFCNLFDGVSNKRFEKNFYFIESPLKSFPHKYSYCLTEKLNLAYWQISQLLTKALT